MAIPTSEHVMATLLARHLALDEVRCQIAEGRFTYDQGRAAIRAAVELELPRPEEADED